MDDTHPICRTCGVQYDTAGFDPLVCRICSDERQYVGWSGQQWTTLAEMQAAGYRNEIREEAPGLTGIGTTPGFAIGQRALVVPGEGGNVLWDCITYLDDETAQAVERLGGLVAIAISHPHYYSSVVEWSRAFGDIPIYVHADDREWVCRDENVEYWTGDALDVMPGRTLINCRVHFAGGTILHWADGAEGRGAVCSGDILQVVPDRRWVSFMYSYPNLIPEHPDTVRRAVRLVAPLEFDAIYGAWWGRNVMTDGKAAVRRSAERYLRHIGAGALD